MLRHFFSALILPGCSQLTVIVCSSSYTCITQSCVIILGFNGIPPLSVFSIHRVARTRGKGRRGEAKWDEAKESHSVFNGATGDEWRTAGHISLGQL